MMPIVAGAATSPGRVRAVNEDRYLVGETVFAVADGMGGHAAGARASRLAIDHVAAIDALGTPSRELVVAAVGRANSAILEESDRVPDERGMGTTLVGMVVGDLSRSAHALVFNVGDSRLYEYDAGRLDQVTIDHSEVQELLDGGQITSTEATTHPHRHVITRAVGSRPQPPVDTWTLPVSAGATFLLCSDGLTSELTLDAIAAVLARTPDPQQAAERLVAAAEDAGGRDNITAVVVRLGEEERHEQLNDDTVPRGISR